jgi:hypothetical protein
MERLVLREMQEARGNRPENSEETAIFFGFLGCFPADRRAPYTNYR